MLTTMKKLVILSLLTVAGSHRFALAADKPTLRTDKASPIEVIRISPSKGDLQRVERKRKQAGVRADEEVQVHVVKIYVDMPAPGAQACLLHIGDEKIKEYGGFAEGVFFKVYDRKQLQSWEGKPVRVVYRNETIDLKITVPATPDKPPEQLPTLGEVLRAGKGQ